MTMPDAVRALIELSRAPRGRLSTCVYNVGAFSPTAADLAERVKRAFPGASIDYVPDTVRAKIVASWPEDVDDSRARSDWGWSPRFDLHRAFDSYLIPNLKRP
jgi:threonine 3-dehydrogenase